MAPSVSWRQQSPSLLPLAGFHFSKVPWEDRRVGASGQLVTGKQAQQEDGDGQARTFLVSRFSPPFRPPREELTEGRRGFLKVEQGSSSVLDDRDGPTCPWEMPF